MVMIGSGVGAPFVLALGIFLVTVSLVAQFVKQPILDTTADKQRAHMLAWEKSNPGARYFLNMLDAHYHKRMPSLLNALASIQKIWHVDQLVVVTQMTNTSDMQELATVTKWGENLTSGKAYIEVFKNNQYAADKNVILDTENGIIELNNNDIRQGLIFTNPLLSPGTETVHRTQEGKNKYKNNLSFLAQKGWQIEDKGTAHTKADFSQVIQHGKAKEGTLRVISITANMGAGDDLVIVSTGATIVDGGQGNNAVDYSKLPARSSIKVRAEGNGYLVQKNIIGGHVLEETIEQKTTHYGKQSETLEYRSVKLITTNSQATDSLSNIQQIIASKGNDEMIGTDSSDQFYGGKGDDTIKTGKGND